MEQQPQVSSIWLNTATACLFAVCLPQPYKIPIVDNRVERWHVFSVKEVSCTIYHAFVLIILISELLVQLVYIPVCNNDTMTCALTLKLALFSFRSCLQRITQRMCRVFQLKIRNVWQSLSCSPPDLAVTHPSERIVALTRLVNCGITGRPPL